MRLPSHDGLQHGPDIRDRLVFQTQDIRVQEAAFGAAEHLLAARQRDLVQRQLDFRPGRVLDELVHDGDVGGVAARSQLGPDAERVDRRAGGHQLLDAVLVEVSGGEDLHVGQAAFVEDGAHGPGELVDVARVEPAARGNNPRARASPGRPPYRAPRSVSYVSMRRDRDPGSRACEEGFRFVLEPHDVRVRHRAAEL
jgi:hypothetical protein